MKSSMITHKVKTGMNIISRHCLMLSSAYAVVGKALSNPRLQDVIAATAVTIVTEVEACVEQIKSNDDLRHDFEEFGRIMQEFEKDSDSLE